MLVLSYDNDQCLLPSSYLRVSLIYLSPRKGETMTDSTNTTGAITPVEQFDMYVAHVGINASNADEAEKIANLFTALMGLPTIEQPPSFFAGTLVEVMKQNGRAQRVILASMSTIFLLPRNTLQVVALKLTRPLEGLIQMAAPFWSTSKTRLPALLFISPWISSPTFIKLN